MTQQDRVCKSSYCNNSLEYLYYGGNVKEIIAMLVSAVSVAVFGATLGVAPVQAVSYKCTSNDVTNGVEFLTPEWTELFARDATVYFSWETNNIGSSVETYLDAANATTVLYGDVMEWQVDVAEMEPAYTKVPVNIMVIGTLGCAISNWVIYLED